MTAPWTTTSTIEQWPARLQAAIAARPSPWKRILVLRETESTQEAARRESAQRGDVIVAWRQTAGRGRLGRCWADTGEDGVAVTFIVERAPPERLSIAVAVGLAEALEPLLHRTVGIKWPNDIVVDGRKLAGILVEQTADNALIGVGVNVSQRAWPGELADRAVSLSQLGATADRLDVIQRLLVSLPAALEMGAGHLADAFAGRDALRGHDAAFISDRGSVSGRVLRVDPMRGLAVATAAGEVWLPAAVTTVTRWEHAGTTLPRDSVVF